MNPRGKVGKVATVEKAPKAAAESFNFFQSCSTSVHPDWAAAGVCKFKLIRKRNTRGRD